MITQIRFDHVASKHLKTAMPLGKRTLGVRGLNRSGDLGAGGGGPLRAKGAFEGAEAAPAARAPRTPARPAMSKQDPSSDSPPVFQRTRTHAPMVYFENSTRWRVPGKRHTCDYDGFEWLEHLQKLVGGHASARCPPRGPQ